MSAVSYDYEVVVGKAAEDSERPIAKRIAGGGLSVWRRIWSSRGTRFLGPLILLGVWQLAVSVGHASPLSLPSPSNVFTTGRHLVANGTLISALLVSLRRVGLGLALGVAIGGSLALLSSLSLVGERLIDPVMHMFRTMPVLALLPLFVVWFGIGEKAKVFIVGWAVVFPIYINLYAGVRSVDEKLVTAGKVLGLGRWGLIRHVILPGALPQFLTGLRLALGVSWLVLVAAEEINATSGLGYMITNAQNLSETNVMFVVLIVFSLLGLATDILVRLIERWTLSWRSSFVTK
ncbi:MAG TPA: ABC transporter permease [Solirubrobacteraceae bacterium]|jgi:sulfonate transport system permease protein|nr:ABC transporter permease [Solirubrobacteraceae bacterium]